MSFAFKTDEQERILRQTLNELEFLLNSDSSLYEISSYFPCDGYANCFLLRIYNASRTEIERLVNFTNERGYVKSEVTFQLTEMVKVTEYYCLTPEMNNYINELRESFNAFYEDIKDYFQDWEDENESYNLTVKNCSTLTLFMIKIHTEMPSKFHKRIKRLKENVIIPNCREIANYHGLDFVYYNHHITKMDIYFKLK